MGFILGEHRFPYGICLGPMAGYTDHAMRMVCHEAGAEYTVTEMVSAKAVCFRDGKTVPLARIGLGEGDVAVQIFGADPVCMAEAAAMIAGGYAGGVTPVAIDINMGCPVHKIVSNGEGSALMRNPALAGRIVRAVAGAIRIPVTVKIRAGFDEASVNAVEMTQVCADNGAAAVTVHGRLRTQMYAGRADYTVIADVVRAVSIPVIGNGDVTDAASARRLTDETGCAGIMVGRAAVGNPFVFSEIRAAMNGDTYTPPTLEKRLDIAWTQVCTAAIDRGETLAVLESRKQLAAYLHGRRGAAVYRNRLNAVTSLAGIRAIFDDILTAGTE